MFFKQKQTKEKPVPIDNNVYTSFEDIIDYVGFINPEGGFYRVRKKGSANGEHGLWAFQHLESLGDKPHILDWNKNITILINKYHYAIIMEDIKNDFPPNYAPEYDELTDAQKQIIDQIYAYYDSKNKTSHGR